MDDPHEEEVMGVFRRAWERDRTGPILTMVGLVMVAAGALLVWLGW
jgi:hypothetical protein